MKSNIYNRRFFTLSLTLAFVCISSQLALSRTKRQLPVGHLTVVGMVKVNGQPAATGDTVASGSSVETGPRSSAVVSLGKLGRVEAQAETRMKLRYDAAGTGGINVLLADGSQICCRRGRYDDRHYG